MTLKETPIITYYKQANTDDHCFLFLFASNQRVHLHTTLIMLVIIIHNYYYNNIITIKKLLLYPASPCTHFPLIHSTSHNMPLCFINECQNIIVAQLL